MLVRARVADQRRTDVEPVERRGLVAAVGVDLDDTQRIARRGRSDQRGKRVVGLGEAMQAEVGEREAFLARRPVGPPPDQRERSVEVVLQDHRHCGDLGCETGAHLERFEVRRLGFVDVVGEEEGDRKVVAIVERKRFGGDGLACEHDGFLDTSVAERIERAHAERDRAGRCERHRLVPFLVGPALIVREVRIVREPVMRLGEVRIERDRALGRGTHAIEAGVALDLAVHRQHEVRAREAGVRFGGIGVQHDRVLEAAARALQIAGRVALVEVTRLAIARDGLCDLLRRHRSGDDVLECGIAGRVRIASEPETHYRQQQCGRQDGRAEQRLARRQEPGEPAAVMRDFGRAGGNACRRADLADEAVAAARDRLDVAWRVGDVVERVPEAPHGAVERRVEIDDAARPEARHEVLPRDDFARMFEQSLQHEQRLRLQAHGDSVAHQLTRVDAQCPVVEADFVRSLHAVVPPDRRLPNVM